jgi:hypothetical protein
MQITYIYVKQCPCCDLLYLGITTKNLEKDPYCYKGSGVYWKKHLKEKNIDNNEIKNWILHKTQDEKELVDISLYYSKLFNVVKNKKWANLKDEGIHVFNGIISTKNKKGISKNNRYIFVLEEDVHTHLKNGWTLGQTKEAKQKRTGKKLSKEIIDKITKSNTGKKRNQESINRMVISAKNKPKVSDTTIKRLIDSHRGHRNYLSKTILQIDKITHNIIAIYESSGEAERATTIKSANIRHCCLGNRKYAGGFIWKFKN